MILLDTDLINFKTSQLASENQQSKVTQKTFCAIPFLSVVVQSRLRRLGQSQSTNFCKLLTSIFSSIDEKSMRCMVLGEDKGYGRSFQTELIEFFGIFSTFIVLQHINKCNSFASKCCLDLNEITRLEIENKNKELGDSN